MNRDPIRAMEAVYSFVPDEEKWLAGIVEALRPYELGRGVAAYVSELGEVPAVRSLVNETRLSSDVLYEMVRNLPAAYYRRLHAPMPLTCSADEFPKAAVECGLPPDTFTLPESTDAWAVCGGDPDLETALVVFHCAPGEKPLAREQHVLDCIGAHLGSALRLRSLLGARPPTSDDAGVEAVFSSEGKLLDARDDVKDPETQAPLIAAVQRLEHSKRRAATVDERVDMWTALVEGRWSIIESVESDGKRVLLACRNDPRAHEHHALNATERAVASYAAFGHPFKYIAYELGIPVPTATAALKSALRKLGLKSRTELTELYARTTMR